MNSRPRGWHPRRAVTAAPILLTICALMLTPNAADAAVTGEITGTVDPEGHRNRGHDLCNCERRRGKLRGNASTNINRSSPGAYTISGLASGEYKVGFAAQCSVKPCHETFSPQYYDNRSRLRRPPRSR